MQGNRSIRDFFTKRSAAPQPIDPLSRIPQVTEPVIKTIEKDVTAKNKSANIIPSTEHVSPSRHESPDHSAPPSADRARRESSSLSSLTLYTTPPAEPSLDATGNRSPTDVVTHTSPRPASRPSRQQSSMTRTKNHVSTGPAMNISTTASTSFRSTSSLTTLPPSSQISARVGSRRIISNGVTVITDSSSEGTPIEIASDSDGDSDLIDIDELLTKKRERSTSFATRGTTSATISRPSRQHLSPLPRDAPRKRYKHDINAMIRAQAQEAQLAEKLKLLEATVMQAEQIDISDGENANVKIDMAIDDDEAGARVKTAMTRMDALDRETVFHFFELDADHVKKSHPDFDNRGQLDRLDWNSLWDGNECTQLAVELTSADNLTIPSLRWLFNQAIFSLDHDLAQTCLRMLQSVQTQDRPHTTYISETHIHYFLASFGVRKDVIQSAQRKPEPLTGGDAATSRASSTSIRRFAQLLSIVPTCLEPQATSSVLYCLCLAMLDNDLRKLPRLLQSLRRAAARIFEALPDDDFTNVLVKTSCHLSISIGQSSLIHKLLITLASSSRRLSTFRRRLALVTLYPASAAPANINLSSADNWSRVASTLERDSAYRVSERTDYALLSARISILDVAIGPGFADFATLLTTSRPTSEESTKSAHLSTALLKAPPTPAEVAFNAGVDAVLGALKRISSEIRDAGAAHMKRTECKTAIERLVVRLEFAVRTRPRPRSTVFGRSVMDHDAERDAMDRFVTTAQHVSKVEQNVAA